MRRLHLSVSGMSIALALALALWEWYFFWFARKHIAGQLEGTLGLFIPERLGFNLAWLVCFYLSFQLISIPFALPATRDRFIGVVDGMASIVPLGVVAVGSCILAAVGECGGPVRGICIQHRSQPPDFRCCSGRPFLKVRPCFQRFRQPERELALAIGAVTACRTETPTVARKPGRARARCEKSAANAQ